MEFVPMTPMQDDISDQSHDFKEISKIWVTRWVLKYCAYDACAR
jgi:hypothetical protein